VKRHRKSLLPHPWRGIIVICCTFLSACAPIPQAVKHPVPAWSHQARALYQSGKYRQAAQAYQKAAQLASPENRPIYLLRSADAWISAGDMETARQILDHIEPPQLPPAERAFHHLLRARVALEAGEPQITLEHLRQLQPKQIPIPLRKRYLELKARALTLQGELLASIQQRVQLGKLLKTPPAVEDNNQAILEALLLIPVSDLDSLQAPSNSDLAGWIALARILRSHPYRSDALDRALALWQNSYPTHPASRGKFLENTLSSRLRTYQPPQRMALLLPATGPYQTASEAIRLGIEAIQNLPDNTFQSQLIEYDTSSLDPVSLYHQASGQGAEFILGPLQKPALEQLAPLEQFNPPLLALNRIEGLSRSGLYQMALPPEDAVEQTAASAWMHGYQNVLMLVPNSPLGDRIEQHFHEYWDTLGGKILEIQYYDPSSTDFSAPLQKLLNIDESRRRFQRLRKVVWEIQFEPRIRRDADFVFLQAGPRQGRLIRPQLMFYKAGYLPVYATRDIYEGHPNPQWDKDLEGIRFCDIPWLLNGEYQSAPSVTQFETEFGKHSGSYLRLAALGMDAYRIPFTLLGTGNQRLAGVTGILQVEMDGRIQPQMTCAEFQQGVPVIYGLAPDIIPQNENIP